MLANIKFRIYWWIPAVIIFILFVHLYSPNLPDTDSFYHIQHAQIYRTQGVFDSAFPWAQYSTIKETGSDLWYGFHILLLPFTLFSDLLVGVEIGGILVTIAAVFMIFFALRRLKVERPEIWLFIFLLASPDLLYRLVMFRPHPLTLGLATLLFAYLAIPEKAGKQNWKVFAASAALSWIHLSLSWLPILIALAVSFIKKFQRQTTEWGKLAALALGLLAGWLLRPNPFGAAKLAYIQIVQLFLEQRAKTPLVFGRELTPFTLENFADQLIPITLIAVLAVIFFLKKRLPQPAKSAAVGSLLLTAGFFYLTFSSARRSVEFFIVFAVILAAILYTNRRVVIIKPLPVFAIMFIAIALIYMPLRTFYRFGFYMRNAFPVERHKEAAIWLKNNTEPEEIVFNLHWDQFAELFFWNPRNYYINGMDPIFQYTLKPALYWKTHFIAKDQATAYTCAKIRCAEEEVEDTITALKNDFQASYIFLRILRNPKVYEYLKIEPRVEKVFDNQKDAIFKIKNKL